MKHAAVLTLLAGALLATTAVVSTSLTPSFAQDVSVGVDVSVSTSAEVSVSTPDVSSVVSEVSSEVSSALSSVSSELSSAVSSASSEVSSAVSSVSSEVSSELSSASSELDSSSMMSSEPMMMECGTDSDDVDVTGMMTSAVDEAALAAVTSVSIVAIGECDGLADIDGSAKATLSTNPAVIDALAAAGEAGAEIVAYTISDASLTVFVRSR